MSISKIEGRYVIAYKNAVWYFHDSRENKTVITDDSTIIGGLFLKEGRNPPYQVLDNLLNNPATKTEWGQMISNYPLV